MKQVYQSLLVILFLFPTVLISQTFNLTGKITRHNGDPVPNLELNWMGTTITTDANGEYLLTGIPVGTFEGLPEAVYPLFEEVTVLDAMLERRQILAQINLNFFQLFEADINNSATITSLDLYKQTKWILHMENNEVPNYQFCADATISICSQLSIQNNVSDTTIVRDLIALKKADVGIWTDHYPPPVEAPSPDLFITTENFMEGEVVEFQVVVTDFTDIYGIQQTIKWDPSLLSFLDIESNTIFENQINEDHLTSGLLPIVSFADENEDVEIVPGGILYTFRFNALADSPDDGYTLQTSNTLTPYQAIWQNPANNSLFIVDGGYNESPTSVFEIEALAAFNIFPNPTSELLTVNIVFENQQQFELEIYNVLGQNIFSQNYEGKNRSIAIPVQDFSNGIYFLNLRVGNEVITKKFLKQ